MGRRTLVLVVALLLAGISAFAVFAFLRNVESDVKEDIEEVTVFRAETRIELGTDGEEAREVIIESTENAEFLPPNAVRSQEELLEVTDGRLTAGPISEFQIITTDIWVDPIDVQTRRLSELITPGNVAVSIRPDVVSAVGGYVRPGDTVSVVASSTVSLANLITLLQDEDARELFLDIGVTDLPVPVQVGVDEEGNPIFEIPADDLETFASALPSSVQFTEIVLQNVEVLAVGTAIRDVGADTGLVPVDGEILTLEVTPSDAERIVFANQYTSVQLLLEPPGFTPADTDGVIVDDLFGLVERFLAILEQANDGG